MDMKLTEIRNSADYLEYHFFDGYISSWLRVTHNGAYWDGTFKLNSAPHIAQLIAIMDAARRSY